MSFSQAPCWTLLPVFVTALAMASTTTFPGLLAEPTKAAAAEFDPQILQELRGRIQKYVDDQTVAGAVAVIGDSLRLVHMEAVGDQCRETRQPMTPTTIFRIASMTKPITAMAVLQLHETGLLDVNDPIEKYLPEFRGQLLASKPDPMGPIQLTKPQRLVTIRDLLTHTSGLPGGFPAAFSELYNSRSLTLKEAVLLQSQRPLEFEPGSKWAYCNSGIDILGRIVEVVSQQSYSDYLQRRIFQPLKMYDTTPFVRPDQRDRVAELYEQKDGRLRPAVRPLVGIDEGAKHPIPAGGLVSTALDLSRLYRCCLRGGELDGARILQPATLRLMTQTQTGDLKTGFVEGMSFGFGFAVVKQPIGITAPLSVGTYGHGGAFGTQGWMDPHQELFVILLIQRVGLPNADASAIRADLQEVAIRALKRPVATPPAQ